MRRQTLRSAASRGAALVPIILFLSLVLSGCTPQQFTNASGYQEISVSGIRLQWKVVNDSLEVILSAPTAGWVAVGFDPTSIMKDANFVIGYVSSGVVTIRDDYGDSVTSHRADTSDGGTDDVSDASGTESGGTTELSFTIPLDSGDSHDRPLTPGQTHKVLLAYSNTEDLTQKHTVRAKVSVIL